MAEIDIFVYYFPSAEKYRCNNGSSAMIIMQHNNDIQQHTNQMVQVKKLFQRQRRKSCLLSFEFETDWTFFVSGGGLG